MHERGRRTVEINLPNLQIVEAPLEFVHVNVLKQLATRHLGRKVAAVELLTIRVRELGL